ncbi:hypothetical protein BpHYR1_045086 [Brachionus plicatilis]|uniref:Uncharacterized protein n=1 Tax=Brachionus plicatilis TaxID=10195 RepID=A0A3M7T0N0_BRAPC|nr:hypothetical protein BpHYR1_045086 [Brachionus plicatilis]
MPSKLIYGTLNKKDLSYEIPKRGDCEVRFNSIFSIQKNLSNIFIKIDDENYKQICLMHYSNFSDLKRSNLNELHNPPNMTPN